VGITLYELCTVRPALRVRKRGELKRAIRRGDLPAPRSVCPHVPVPLAAIIMKAAAVDPRHRYQSADELVSDLLRFLNGEHVAASSQRWLGRKRSQ
jgi:serine/threonine protein kinase